MNIISVQCLCMYMCIYIYIFLRTINAARIFCLTSGPTRSWRNGAAQCYQLSNISDPFRNFFPFKKVPKPYFVSENRRYCLSLSLSLSLSLCICSCSVSVQEAERSSALIQLNTDIMLFFKFYMQVYLKSQHSYCLYLVCIWFNQTTARLSGFLCRLTSWKGELVM